MNDEITSAKYCSKRTRRCPSQHDGKTEPKPTVVNAWIQREQPRDELV
jgi:hypothetical protein